MSGRLRFPPFEFDAGEARLTRDGEVVPLRPKTLGILRALTEQPGHLITKDALLDAVWPDIEVTDAVLKVSIRELRAALADDARAPRFIETVHRIGYRFIAPVDEDRATAPAREAALPGAPAAGSGEASVVARGAGMVGRARELALLGDALAGAFGGSRRVVLVTGEPGIGKTTLLDRFLATVSAPPGRDASGAPGDLQVWIAKGQCVEHYGEVEAFLPVLEGLGRLCRAPGGDRLASLLREHAPSWLAQLPGAIPAAERESLERRVAGGTRERMLRELVVGIEALTAARPLVVAIEDLHWADRSTLDLLAALARRGEPARLLVVATYRGFDPLAGTHPLPVLASELTRHRLATSVSLERLDRGAVADFLEARLGATALDPAIADLLHRHTEGNPLFLVSAVEHLVERGLLGASTERADPAASLEEVAREVPRSLAQMIAAQLATLGPEDREVLEAASAAGEEVATQLLAAAVELEPAHLRAASARLARRRWLRSLGPSEWPDGTRGERLALAHGLYREALLAGLAPARRARLHACIAARLEEAWRGREAEAASELGAHFAAAGSAARAVEYLRLAARGALRRHAYGEAIAQLERALGLLATIAPSADRDATELELRVLLGVPLINTRGFAAPDVEATYARARSLCERLDATPQLFPILEGLHTYHAIKSDLPRAYAFARQMLALADRDRDPHRVLEAHHVLGTTELRRAELRPAIDHLERALALYDPAWSETAHEASGHDPRVCCEGYLGIALWTSGAPDAGIARVLAALRFAREIRHPSSLAQACAIAAWAHLLRGERAAADALVAETAAISREHGFPYWSAMALMLAGWSRARAGDAASGLAQLREGHSVCELIGVGVGEVEYLAMVADACLAGGLAEEGLAATEDALAVIERSGDRLLEADVTRMRGELLLAAATAGERPGETTAYGERELERALALARERDMLAYELRAGLALAALWQARGASARGRSLLAPIAARFEGGADTADLRRAAALLAPDDRRGAAR